MKFILRVLSLGLGVACASVASSQERPFLDLPTIVSPDMTLSKEVAYQCGGLVRYWLSNLESVSRADTLPMGLDSDKPLRIDPELPQVDEMMARAWQMYQFFSERAETMEITSGLNSEIANYRRGMTMIYYEQKYRAIEVEALESALPEEGGYDILGHLFREHRNTCETFYVGR